MRRLGQRDAVRSVNVGDLAQELPVLRIDHYHAILARDEHAVVRWVGNDIVPAAIAAEDKRVRDLVMGLRRQAPHGPKHQAEHYCAHMVMSPLLQCGLTSPCASSQL